MIVGRIWNAKITAYCAALGAERAVHHLRPDRRRRRAGRTRIAIPRPSMPAAAGSGRRATRTPACRSSVLTTINANRTCRPSPQPTTRGLIARRLVESAYASARMPTSPINGWSRVNMSTGPHQSVLSALSAAQAVATNICSPLSCTQPITSGASGGACVADHDRLRRQRHAPSPAATRRCSAAPSPARRR